MIRVGINGYGVIGSRLADAILLQKDMTLVGVSKVHADYVARHAKSKGIKLYAAGNRDEFTKKGIPVSGALEDLLANIDVMVDCTPEGNGAKNKSLYEKYGCKAVWQGGEEHDVAGLSFNAYANYDSARKAEFLRVVSCNTTALIRTLYPLHSSFGIKEARAVLIRRAADPSETKKGPINALEPDENIPSHHGPDVQTVMPEIKIRTVAVKASTTLMHLHYIEVELDKKTGKEDVLNVWKKHRRIAMFSFSDGVRGTAQIMDYARHMGRNRGDMYETAVWDNLSISGNTLSYFQAVHQEADVIPENVDAIRAMLSPETSARDSIYLTDTSLRIGIEGTI